MKKIFIILVLFYSTSVFSETYTCKLSYKDGYSDQNSYDIIITIHEDANVGPIVLLDKQNSFKHMIVPGIQSVGKVYSDNYPFGGGKIIADAYFTMISPWAIQGFFVNMLNFIPLQIDIKQRDPEKILIWIHDPQHIMFSNTNSKGECK